MENWSRCSGRADIEYALWTSAWLEVKLRCVPQSERLSAFTGFGNTGRDVSSVAVSSIPRITCVSVKGALCSLRHSNQHHLGNK